ncbi:prenyltransferase [bacterium]|nr:prenyltransferase [bacterium]
MSDRLTLWYRAARGYTFGLSAIPYILGAFLASVNYAFNLRYCTLGLIGVLLVHASFNLLDDYHDWVSGMVESYKESESPKNTRLNKAFYLEEGLISPKELMFAIGFCWTVALFIGIFLAFTVSFTVLQIAFVGALFAMAYTIPPVELNKKGLGELTIGIIFGPLVMMGAYIVAGGGFCDSVCIISSLIIGILIANTAHTHSILDFEADLKNDKRTLSVCLLSKNKAIFIQLVLYVWAFLLLFLGIVYKIFPREALLTLFTFPLAVELNELMFNEETEHKLWYGPITQLKNNIDNYFMLRLCMARNVVMFFAFLLGLTYYLYS